VGLQERETTPFLLGVAGLGAEMLRVQHRG
jgi:hypothetical protein